MGVPASNYDPINARPCLRVTLGLAAALLAVVVPVPAAVPAQAGPRVYVANLGSASVSVIDATTNAVSATIPVGSDPDGIAATPDGQTVFVSNFVSDSVSRIDAATNTVVDTIPVGDGPVGVAVSPDGTVLYVANKLADTVSVLRADTGEPVSTLPAGSGPNGVAVHPGGALAYVTNSRTRNPGTVTVIDARANAVIGAIPVQHSPGRAAFSPDGSRAYVTNFNSWTVSVIDTAAGAVVDTLATWGRPAHVAVHPNGAFVYVSALGGRVQVIDARTYETAALIGVETSPYSFVLLPTGALGFATGFDVGTVSVVDAVAERETAVIPVGVRPFAAAVVCPGGCTDVPFTPAPTRTPTDTRPVPPTHTPPPTGTPVPTLTPAPSPHVALMATVPAADAGQVTIEVRLEGGGEAIAGVQNDFVFDRFALRLASRDACVINPAVSDAAPECEAEEGSAPCKTLSTPGQWACYDSVSPVGCPEPNSDPRSRVRALLFSFSNTRPVPDGPLYACTFDILDPTRLPATVVMANAVASSPTGQRLPVATTDVVVDASTVGSAGAAATRFSWLAIDVADGPIIDLPFDGSRPVQLATGMAGDVWFTDAGTDRVGRIDANGELMLFRLRALSGPAGLAVDAAGIVWVALNDRNRLARIDPGIGAVDEFVLPRAAQPFGVAAGPDGAVWFTEIGENAIGRLNPDGTLTHFPLPTRLAAPAGIVAAADGHLWFTEHNANRIGRIDVTGAIMEYPLPSPGSGPLGIAIGADGAVWFTELRGGRIGRIGADGMLTEVNLPGRGSRPMGIAAGGDGSVWVTDGGTRQVLRLTPRGNVEIVSAARGIEAGSLFGAGVATVAGGDTIIYAATAEGRLVRAAIAAADPTATPTPSPSPTPTPTPVYATPTSPVPPSPTRTATSPSTVTVRQATETNGGGCQTTADGGPAAWMLLLPYLLVWWCRPHPAGSRIGMQDPRESRRC